MPDADGLKAAVRAHWEAEACGTRGISAADRHAFFTQLERFKPAL